MKTIVIGFSKSTLFFPLGSWLIRLYQLSEYSHCYIKLLSTPKFPSNKILHAAEGQVCQYSETAFLTRNKITHEFSIKITDELYTDLVRNVFHEKSGEKYSTWQNVGLVFSRLLNVKNPFTTGWNCSEYAAYVLKKIYPNKYIYNDLNKITPKDVYKFLKSLES